MILLLAIGAGLLAGFWGAHWHDRPYRPPPFKFVWLASIAFIPQLLVAYLPATHHLAPVGLAAIGLWTSLVLFTAFVWLNRRLPGMPVLLVGLMMNLTTMAANGGWMPISPQTAGHLHTENAAQAASLGGRFGQKDILLPAEKTQLAFLADRFLLPPWSPYQVAFSLGDILIAAGAFWLLARAPASAEIPIGVNHDDHNRYSAHEVTPENEPTRRPPWPQQPFRGSDGQPELPRNVAE